MSATRPWVIAVSDWREVFVHECLNLTYNGKGPMNESREAPLGWDRSFFIPQDTLRRRAKYRDVFWQSATDIPKEVCPLRKDVVTVAIGQPILV
jgi:hypothetical protein